MPKVTEVPPPRALGVVGAGQLARMMGEAASELGIEMTVLASDPSDAAASIATRTLVGAADDPHSLAALAAVVEVITLDHELVDLDELDALAERGTPVWPASSSVIFASRKDHQRREFQRRDIPVPHFVILEEPTIDDLEAFATTLGHVPVVKAARGGYDGRGVVMATTLAEAMDAALEFATRGPVLLEERLALLGEVAVLVATGLDGSRVTWPVVRTVQSDGMCAEVRFPSGLSATEEQRATQIAVQVADVVGAIGVLAVELFWTAEGILVNEVATRPHNSGHWTIEGSLTSQFENHLRAVLGLPLGATEPLATHVVMVNVVGSATPGDLAAALAITGVHVHDYGKSWRPGRKLGHVTVAGTDPESVRVRAWAGAEALGTALEKDRT